MLFMVIERFVLGDVESIGERFRSRGRMLPEGVNYVASWVDLTGSCCFQIMEAVDAERLDEWIQKWNDLAAFEVIPVLSSADFWAQRDGR